MYGFGVLIDHQKVRATTMKCFVTTMVAGTVKAAASKLILTKNDGNETGAYSRIFLFGADVFN